MPHEFRHSALNIRLSGQIRQPLSPTPASILFSRLTAFNAFATLPERQVRPIRRVRGKPSTMSKFGIGQQAFDHPISSREASVDINKQVAALTASELQTAGASERRRSPSVCCCAICARPNWSSCCRRRSKTTRRSCCKRRGPIRCCTRSIRLAAFSKAPHKPNCRARKPNRRRPRRTPERCRTRAVRYTSSEKKPRQSKDSTGFSATFPLHTDGAREGTRTPTPLRASGPKPGASTNFATLAAGQSAARSARCPACS